MQVFDKKMVTTFISNCGHFRIGLVFEILIILLCINSLHNYLHKF